MDWIATAEKFLNNPTVANVVTNVSKPKAPKPSQTVIKVDNPIKQGLSGKAIALIGAGVLGVVVVLVMVIRKK